MKLKKNEIILLTVLLILIIALGYVFLFLVPEQKKTGSLLAEIASTNQAISDADQRITDYLQLKGAKTAAEADNQAWVDTIPKSFDYTDILDRINLCFPDTAALNISLGAAQQADSAVTQIYPVSISFETSYAGLQNILKTFENDDSCKVTHLTYSVNSGTDTLKVSATVEYMVYGSK